VTNGHAGTESALKLLFDPMNSRLTLKVPEGRYTPLIALHEAWIGATP
jgi:hypothetical protein